MKITMELDGSDAILLLGVVADKKLEALAHRQLGGEATAIADLTLPAWSRMEARLTNLLYQGCSWLGDYECDRPPRMFIGERAWCAMHAPAGAASPA